MKNGKFKRTLSILSTNWVHLVGFYITTYLSLIFFKLLGLEDMADYDWWQTLIESLATILVLFLTYGALIIAGFFTVIFLLDILGFNLFPKRTGLILSMEWQVIAPAFIYWAFEYEYWLWLTLLMSFAITQWMRKKKILEINSRYIH